LTTMLKEILDAGAGALSNRSEDLIRRSILAVVMQRAGVVEDTAQALAAFRMWTHENWRAKYTPEDFIAFVKTAVPS
jgi:hypothetical protein